MMSFIAKSFFAVAVGVERNLMVVCPPGVFHPMAARSLTRTEFMNLRPTGSIHFIHFATVLSSSSLKLLESNLRPVSSMEFSSMYMSTCQFVLGLVVSFPLVCGHPVSRRLRSSCDSRSVFQQNFLLWLSRKWANTALQLYRYRSASWAAVEAFILSWGYRFADCLIIDWSPVVIADDSTAIRFPSLSVGSMPGSRLFDSSCWDTDPEISLDGLSISSLFLIAWAAGPWVFISDLSF